MTESRPAFRLIHSSDWHIGHELFSHEREAEHEAFLSWLLDRLVAEEADLLLVTGDIYDVANPPVSAMARLYAFLRDATTRCPNLQIVIIGGNHDSAARINLPAALLGPGRNHLIGSLPRVNGIPDFERMLVPLKDRAGTIVAWLAAVPYCRPGDMGSGGLPELYENVLTAGAERANGLPLIVTGHLHVAEGDVSEHSERRITVGGEEAQATSLFDDRAAYVALGHLHRPQTIKGDTLIRYAGSPFPLSATERLYRHSICIVDLAAGGAVAREEEIPRVVPFLTVPAEGPKPIGEVELAIQELDFDPELPRGLHPFVEVSVLVDGPEPSLQARVMAALDGKPLRLTRISRVSAREATNQSIAEREVDLAELLPEAVFAELFERAHGSQPPEDLSQAFQTLLIETRTSREDA
ncbi:exonuclease subunit SbcD [Sphingomonadales bacterium 56]|uniref:exonuclease SbcCD subunit D C-terminal domain-containing protein n=1 Tax=Sphingobium sp. S6 TaxID=2758386 RepID=UPI00191866D1|nr:exonuclease SbcCD subunit D C-terminal domain-containing protein [Sphingobium sp. S6]MBY2929407.1 exonuclease subunit SbcD [Sphingomonadales bacterium 56]CAD7339404.1 Nuclease SbcCD subunit D [Sphingobium sp. S6]